MGTTINKLTRADVISGGDLFAVWSTANSITESCTLNQVLDYMQDNLVIDGTPEYVTQRYSPQATGFSITVNDGTDHGDNVHLILTPAAGYATGTIVLPSVLTAVDKQQVLVTSTNQVTALTVTLSGGATGVNIPSTIAAGKSFCLKLDKDNSMWYCIWR